MEKMFYILKQQAVPEVLLKSRSKSFNKKKKT